MSDEIELEPIGNSALSLPDNVPDVPWTMATFEERGPYIAEECAYLDSETIEWEVYHEDSGLVVLRLRTQDTKEARRGVHFLAQCANRMAAVSHVCRGLEEEVGDWEHAVVDEGLQVKLPGWRDVMAWLQRWSDQNHEPVWPKDHPRRHDPDFKYSREKNHD